MGTRRVCETRMPPRQKSQNMAKIAQVLNFDPAPKGGGGGGVMSVKCAEPID